VRRLRMQEVESIAVCLLFSFLNPDHEKRVKEIIREEAPDVRVSLSHEVMPTAPEFERTSTTLVDAYVGPRVASYLERLERDVDSGLPNSFYPFIPGYAEDRILSISPQVSFGRPVIARRGVSVGVLAERFDAGEALADIANDYDLEVLEVEKALTYERAA